MGVSTGAIRLVKYYPTFFFFSKHADYNNTQLIENLLANNDLSYSAQHSADAGRLI